MYACYVCVYIKLSFCFVIQIFSGELTTSNTLSLLLKRDGDDQDPSAFDEVVLPERTHHCLLQSIAGMALL